MGIDAKSVQSGLSSVTGYVKSWQTKRKTDEEAYTSWWARELKQREEMEIASATRAASRSNQARRLWRQRAESREAAANARNNEILGKGDGAIMAGSLGGLFTASAKNGLKSIFKATVVSAIIAAIYETIPDWQQIMDWWYKTNDEKNNRIKKDQEELRQKREIRDEDAAVAANKAHDEKMKAIADEYDLASRLAAAVDAQQMAALRAQTELWKQLQDAKRKRPGLNNASNMAFDDMSNLSLGEASRQVGVGDFGNYNFSRQQQNDLWKLGQLEHNAVQAKIDGNNQQAWNLTRDRNALLKKMPWLKDADRNPLKGVIDAVNENQKTMDELLDKAKSVGLKVNIVDIKV